MKKLLTLFALTLLLSCSSDNESVMPEAPEPELYNLVGSWDIHGIKSKKTTWVYQNNIGTITFTDGGYMKIHALDKVIDGDYTYTNEDLIKVTLKNGKQTTIDIIKVNAEESEIVLHVPGTNDYLAFKSTRL